VETQVASPATNSLPHRTLPLAHPLPLPLEELNLPSLLPLLPPLPSVGLVQLLQLLLKLSPLECLETTTAPLLPLPLVPISPLELVPLVLVVGLDQSPPLLLLPLALPWAEAWAWGEWEPSRLDNLRWASGLLAEAEGLCSTWASRRKATRPGDRRDVEK
jgi:hypothetical protein